ncbi:acyl-CoA desaturase [Dictyobacter halimunensis]
MKSSNRAIGGLMKSSPLYKSVLILVVTLPFLATIYAMWALWNRAVFLSDIVMLLIMYTCITFGVTAGFHRMLTHRSFRAHPIIKFLLLVFGSMSLEGSALEWASTHVKHHAQADKEGDPHSPTEGFIHAHLGWLFKDRMADPNVYCRNLVNDRMVVFVSRTFLVWVVLSLLIPLAIGGWHGLLWAGLVRIFIVHHVTWSVNSICHTFGKREFETTDKSRNEWIVGLLAFGEGWHNNHHAFPRSAFHGLHWWQVDLSAYLIRAMEKVGLVKDVYRIPTDMLKNRYQNMTPKTALAPSTPIIEKVASVSK